MLRGFRISEDWDTGLSKVLLYAGLAGGCRTSRHVSEELALIAFPMVAWMLCLVFFFCSGTAPSVLAALGLAQAGVALRPLARGGIFHIRHASCQRVSQRFVGC